MDLNAKDKARLQRAVDGNKSEQGYIFGTKDEFKSLAEAGLVVFNDQITDGKKVALKATDAGTAAATAGASGVAATEIKPTFKVTKGIAIPAIKRRVGEATGSKYPFDGLEIGDSFHVAPTKDMPEPAKSMASSVTAANRRYAEKVEGTHKSRKGKDIQNIKLTRQFVVRAVGKDDPDGAGARIWRSK